MFAIETALETHTSTKLEVVDQANAETTGRNGNFVTENVLN